MPQGLIHWSGLVCPDIKGRCYKSIGV